MGKDKKPAAPPPPPVEDKKAGGGRGHRQRGAGTVIVAKAPVVTNDGVVLKPHERLPSQLLHEYCQREKRTVPKYFREPPGTRLKVVLSDPKNSKNNLSFCPEQSFDSESLAKDYAALLALYHMQRSLPLERKLPEPFASTWLQLIRGDGSTSGLSSSRSTKPIAIQSAQPESLVAISNGNGNSNSKKSVASVSTAPSTALTTTTTTTDCWLCDACGVSNFRTTATGVVRIKCFRCQAAKPEIVSGGVTAAATNSKGNHANSISNPTTDNNVKAKKQPQAVLDLRAKGVHVSTAEKEMQRQQQRAIRNRHRSFMDALKRANQPRHICFSLTLQRRLERLFNLQVLDNEVENDETDNQNEKLSAVLRIFEKQQKCLVSAVDTKLAFRGQFVVLRRCLDTLISKGNMEEILAELLLDFINDESKRQDLTEDLLLATNETDEKSSILSTLEDLVLQYFRQQLSLKSNENDSQKEENGERYVGVNLSPEVQQLLESLGYPQSLIHKAAVLLSYYALNTINENDDFPVNRMVLISHLFLVSSPSSELQALLCQKIEKMVQQFNTALPNLPTSTRSEDILNEQLALSSIFETNFTILESVNSEFLEYHITGLTQQDGKLKLELTLVVLIANDCNYPHDAPVAYVMLSNSKSNKVNSKKMGFMFDLNSQLLLKCEELKGQCVVYDLHAMVVEYLEGGKRMNVPMWKEVEKKVDQLLARLTNINQSVVVQEVAEAAIDDKETDVENESEVEQFDELQQEQEEEIEKSIEKLSLSALPPPHSLELQVQAPKASKAIKSKGTHPFWLPSPYSPPSSNNNATTTAVAGVSEERQRLPAYQSRYELLSLLAQHSVIIVTGETGCGKSTQTPQYILEHDPQAKIVVCQPRRLAATGVAMRVAEEISTSVPAETTSKNRKSDVKSGAVGDEVGYMVKGDVKATSNTQILFCTYGILLRRLQENATLDSIQYIILDEIHERGIDSDFILALLLTALEIRNNTGKRKNPLKLILMSATISTDHFQSYLQNQLQLPNVPVLFIPGFTYEVTEFFKNDYEEMVRAVVLPSQKATSYEDEEDDYYEKKKETSLNDPRRKDVDYDLLVRLVLALTCCSTSSSLASNVLQSATAGRDCILIFLPGIAEIQRVITLLTKHWPSSNSSMLLYALPLHGNLSPAEQRLVFQRAPSNRHIKIVCSTNVAEASVTIPDVTIVIDTCRVKLMQYDHESQAYCLLMQLAAKDSLRQRRGRAGRVQAGRCYKMITKNTFTNRLAEQTLPEMLRMPLDSVLLQTLSMLDTSNTNANGGDKKATAVLYDQAVRLLQRCPTPPSQDMLISARDTLFSLQAIHSADGELTALGKHLSRLPCTPRTGRLLVYGTLLRCTLPSTAIAAVINSNRSPFIGNISHEQKESMLLELQRRSTTKTRQNVIKSDFLLYAYLIVQFMQLGGMGEKRQYCCQYQLSFERMNELVSNTRDFLQDLVDIQLIPSVSVGISLNHNSTLGCNAFSHRSAVINAVCTAGLYPQVARLHRPPKKFVEVMGSALERDVNAKEIKIFVPKDDVNTAVEEEGNGDEEDDIEQVINDSDLDLIRTRHLQRVFLHPASINFGNNSFKPSNYLLYNERSLTVNYVDGKPVSKIVLRDSMEASQLSLCLFGGGIMDIKSRSTAVDSDELEVHIENGWIRFSVNRRTAEILQVMKLKLDAALNVNDVKSTATVEQSDDDIIAAVADALEEEII